MTFSFLTADFKANARRPLMMRWAITGTLALLAHPAAQIAFLQLWVFGGIRIRLGAATLSAGRLALGLPGGSGIVEVVIPGHEGVEEIILGLRVAGEEVVGFEFGSTRDEGVVVVHLGGGIPGAQGGFCTTGINMVAGKVGFSSHQGGAGN